MGDKASKPVVLVVAPVPPLATVMAVPLQVPVAMVPRVVMFEEPTQVESAVFSTLPSPTSDLLTADQEVVPSPAVFRNCPLIPLVVGKVILVLVPFPFSVSEPPIVVLAFFRMESALLRLSLAVPFPTTKRRSVAI